MGESNVSVELFRLNSDNNQIVITQLKDLFSVD